jgi:dUTP pyrophosphatase
MSEISLNIKLNDSNCKMPEYKTAGSSGMDVCSIESKLILPSMVAIISTGLSFEIPEGYEIQVRPRSGLAANNSITVLNTPGTIDSDYRGKF